jgi:flagellar assembly protein FliH
MSRVIRSASISGVRKLNKDNQTYRDLKLSETVVTEDEVVEVISSAQGQETPDHRGIPPSNENVNLLESEIDRLTTLCREQAEKIQLLYEEIESIHSSSEKEGYTDGYERGKADGEGEYHESLKEVEKLKEVILRGVDQQVDGLQDQILALAFASICKVLGENALSEQVVTASVKNVLEEFRFNKSVKVFVAPDQLVNLSAEKEGVLSSFGKEVEFIPDPKVELGGCIVQINSGSWDGRLEVQLQRLMELFRQMKGQVND